MAAFDEGTEGDTRTDVVAHLPPQRVFHLPLSTTRCACTSLSLLLRTTAPPPHACTLCTLRRTALRTARPLTPAHACAPCTALLRTR